MMFQGRHIVTQILRSSLCRANTVMLIQRFQIQAGVESEFTTLQGSTDEDALLPYNLDAILNPYSAKAIFTPSNAPSLRCCKEATERTSNQSSTSTAKAKARRMGFQLQRRAFMVSYKKTARIWSSDNQHRPTTDRGSNLYIAKSPYLESCIVARVRAPSY